jgi:hypothetical protein
MGLVLLCNVVPAWAIVPLYVASSYIGPSRSCNVTRIANFQSDFGTCVPPKTLLFESSISIQTVHLGQGGMPCLLNLADEMPKVATECVSMVVSCNIHLISSLNCFKAFKWTLPRRSTAFAACSVVKPQTNRCVGTRSDMHGVARGVSCMLPNRALASHAQM